MTWYDLYMFGERQVLLGWHRFEAEDDAAAIAIADGLATHPPLELCRESVVVKRWEKGG